MLLDQQHADAGVVGDAAQHRQQLLHDDRRQAEAHLVDQQQPGRADQRPGPGPASAARRPTAARPCGRARAPAPGTTRGPRSSGVGVADARPAQPQVLGDGEVEEQAAVLGHVGDAGAGQPPHAGGPHPRPVARLVAEHRGRSPPVDGDQPRDGEQGGGLAGAVGARAGRPPRPPRTARSTSCTHGDAVVAGGERRASSTAAASLDSSRVACRAEVGGDRPWGRRAPRPACRWRSAGRSRARARCRTPPAPATCRGRRAARWCPRSGRRRRRCRRAPRSRWGRGRRPARRAAPAWAGRPAPGPGRRGGAGRWTARWAGGRRARRGRASSSMPSVSPLVVGLGPEARRSMVDRQRRRARRRRAGSRARSGRRTARATGSVRTRPAASRSCGGSVVERSPSKVMPAVGVAVKPVRASMKVVLPAPLGPISPTIWPSVDRRATRRRAPPAPPWRRCSPRDRRAQSVGGHARRSHGGPSRPRRATWPVAPGR